MLADQIRFLFAYDRWATRNVLAALDGIDRDAWIGATLVDKRGLGAILIHHLGASQRWRVALQTQGAGEGPEPEREPLLSVDEVRRRWEAEWAAVDSWIPTLTDDFLAYVHEGVPLWVMMAHVVNHGTQHRAEAGALLALCGRSFGEVDLVDYAEEHATARQASSQN